MTPQEFFDRTAEHLFKQGRRSLIEYPNGVVGGCAYRSKDGLKCAIGYWIPDKAYVATMEGRACFAAEVIKALPIEVRRFAASNGLASALQSVHDLGYNWSSTNDMCRALKSVAKRFKLRTGNIAKMSFVDR